MVDSDQFILKNKLIIYTWAFVKGYNWEKRKKVNEIYRIIEPKKIHTLIVKNLYNFSTYQIIEIPLVLYNIPIFPRNQDNFRFYINNSINWNQFNQLYNSDQIEKGIKNVDAITYKLKLALIKATNYRLKVSKKERRKKEKIVEKWKTKARAIKY